MYLEFDRDALIALDAKTIGGAKVDDMAIKNGAMSTDEWRESGGGRNLPHSGHNIQQVPVNVASAGYVVQAEALKLEGMRFDNALKAAQLAVAVANVDVDESVEPTST